MRSGHTLVRLARLAVVPLAVVGLAGCLPADSSSATIDACATPGGTIRIIDPAHEQCAKGERAMTWNVSGPAGAKGDSGAVGAKGDTGDGGATGDTGPKGDKGDTGDKGDIGAQGPQGVQGAPGPQGVPGQKGDRGPAGQNGASASYSRTSSGNQGYGPGQSLGVVPPIVPDGNYVVTVSITAKNALPLPATIGCFLGTGIQAGTFVASYATPVLNADGTTMSFTQVVGSMQLGTSPPFDFSVIPITCLVSQLSSINWIASVVAVRVDDASGDVVNRYDSSGISGDQTEQPADPNQPADPTMDQELLQKFQDLQAQAQQG